MLFPKAILGRHLRQASGMNSLSTPPRLRQPSLCIHKTVHETLSYHKHCFQDNTSRLGYYKAIQAIQL